MKADSLKFLEELMNQPSPSGFEVPARKVIKKRMSKFTDNISVDVHGNISGVLNPDAKHRVMLAGHMDEIGLMITHIDANGYLFFAGIGGWDPLVAVSQRVVVLTKKGEVPGVIGRKPIHLISNEDRGKPVKLEDLWVDIGAKDKKDAESVVAIGDPIVVKPDFIKLRNNLCSSRAFDDRCGAWVVVETLRYLAKKELNVAVHAVCTVQEELGLRGAMTSGYSVNPDAAIAVDVGFSSDFPEAMPKKTGDVKLGDGPILHRGPNINPVLGEMLCDVADAKKIKYQMQAEPRATGTDANAIQVARGGCATALVSVPNRYMHSPVEVISLDDLENSVKLIGETILQMTGNECYIPS